jgi:hypothetical protein
MIFSTGSASLIGSLLKISYSAKLAIQKLSSLQAKKHITDERNQLGAETVEACEQQKNWKRRRLV